MWKQIKADEVIQRLNDGAIILDVDLRNRDVTHAGRVSTRQLLIDMKSSDCYFFEKVNEEI